jgi:hypothetical protein
MFDRKAWTKNYLATHREQTRKRDRERGVVRRAASGFSTYQADKILKCRYGISLEQKKQMYDDQKGLCKLCGKSLPDDFRKAAIDHDHDTDEIRGLLHLSCNWMVGIVETKADLIVLIHGYLERAKGE